MLRAATAADQGLIRKLVREARLNTRGLAWPNFVVAEEIGTSTPRVVGMGQLRPHRDGTLELASILVLPEMQGRGVGSQIVNTLIARADRPLYLMCRGEKVSFYARFGFVEVTEAAAVPRALRLYFRLAAWLRWLLVRLPGQPRLAILVYGGLG